jgi:hypothetical protein
MLPRVLQRFFVQTDDLLRGSLAGPAQTSVASRAGILAHLVLTTILFGMLYGAVMGTFGGLEHGRWLQVLYSAMKVPLLLGVGFVLSLPSFFVLNTVFGVRADFADVWRALLATQAGLTVVLASLAPFTAFWYLSDGDYDTALTFNAAMFGVATLAAQWMLRRAYRPLVARNSRHRLLLRTWLATYAFVTIQMAWVLRPFVGSPGAPVSFFRREAWGNAYIELFHIALRAVAG